MCGPTETPDLSLPLHRGEGQGPEEGQELALVTQQGWAGQGQNQSLGLPTSCWRLSPMSASPRRGAVTHPRAWPPSWTSAHAHHPTHARRQLLPRASLCPSFQTTRGGGARVLRPSVRGFTHTVKVICADRDGFSHIKGDL